MKITIELTEEYEFTLFKDLLHKRKKIQAETFILDKPVSILNLSVRASTCLRKENVRTVRELVEMPAQQFATIPKLGRCSINHIKSKLRDFGLYLFG